MKPSLPWAGALLSLGLAATLAQAQVYTNRYPIAHPYYNYYTRRAPDAMGPGFYAVNEYGGVYGPIHYLVPPGLPFNGITPPIPPINTIG